MSSSGRSSAFGTSSALSSRNVQEIAREFQRQFVNCEQAIQYDLNTDEKNRIYIDQLFKYMESLLPAETVFSIEMQLAQVIASGNQQAYAEFLVSVCRQIHREARRLLRQPQAQESTVGMAATATTSEGPRRIQPVSEQQKTQSLGPLPTPVPVANLYAAAIRPPLPTPIPVPQRRLLPSTAAAATAIGPLPTPIPTAASRKRPRSPVPAATTQTVPTRQRIDAASSGAGAGASASGTASLRWMCQPWQFGKEGDVEGDDEDEDKAGDEDDDGKVDKEEDVDEPGADQPRPRNCVPAPANVSAGTRTWATKEECESRCLQDVHLPTLRQYYANYEREFLQTWRGMRPLEFARIHSAEIEALSRFGSRFVDDEIKRTSQYAELAALASLSGTGSSQVAGNARLAALQAVAADPERVNQYWQEIEQQWREISNFARQVVYNLSLVSRHAASRIQNYKTNLQENLALRDDPDVDKQALNEANEEFQEAIAEAETELASVNQMQQTDEYKQMEVIFNTLAEFRTAAAQNKAAGERMVASHFQPIQRRVQAAFQTGQYQSSQARSFGPAATDLEGLFATEAEIEADIKQGQAVAYAAPGAESLELKETLLRVGLTRAQNELKRLEPKLPEAQKRAQSSAARAMAAARKTGRQPRPTPEQRKLERLQETISRLRSEIRSMEQQLVDATAALQQRQVATASRSSPSPRS